LLVTPGHQALLLSAASSCRSWTGLWLFPGGTLIIPAIVWFVKVQATLNRYWEGKASAAAGIKPFFQRG
jgi:hypothetical protein